MPQLIFNGRLQEQNSLLVGANNRGLRYGDGLFETVKFANGSLILSDAHTNRLWAGMHALQFDIPSLLTPDVFISDTLKLLQKEKLSYARVRWMIIRNNGGLFDPENLKPSYIIQAWPLHTQEALNENGLHLCIYGEARKSTDTFANLKHNNYLPYLMGALHAKSEKCNDALILNQHGRIADSCIANVFALIDDTWYTPSLQEGCVAGVMRQFLLQSMQEIGLRVDETQLEPSMLIDASEVFLSNSIYNLRWVGRIDNKTFGRQAIMELHRQLRQTKPEIFC